nr:MAG TPA: TRAFFICKING PROTEIN/DNA Complex domain, RHH protein, DNA.0A [Caudoviricetes sp.]
MPRELHHKILNQARQQHRSVSGQCLFFIHKVLTPERGNLVQEK